MLSTKAWRDRLHKKRKSETHNVMRLKPDLGVGGIIQLHHEIETEPITFASVGIVQVRKGVVFFGDPANVENVMM